jgi:hypothetical protein
MLFAEKVGHEGMHTSRREKDGGIVFRNQGRGRNYLVSAVFEKV